MAKRELIDRNNLESTTIVTDDFSGNELLDVVLMEDVKEAPVITEQEIVKPYLEKLKTEVEKKHTKAKQRGWVLKMNAYTDCLQMIDNLLSESEEENESNNKRSDVHFANTDYADVVNGTVRNR